MESMQEEKLELIVQKNGLAVEKAALEVEMMELKSLLNTARGEKRTRGPGWPWVAHLILLDCDSRI